MGSQKHTARIVNNMGQEVNNKGRKVKFMGLKFNNMAWKFKDIELEVNIEGWEVYNMGLR